MTQVLVTKPGTLTAADRKKLRAAGVVAVEADNPQDIRLIGAEGAPLDGNDIAFAALRALNTGQTYASDAREVFTKVMFEMMGSLRKAMTDDA